MRMWLLLLGASCEMYVNVMRFISLKNFQNYNTVNTSIKYLHAGMCVLSLVCKATVTQDRTISLSYDWLRFGERETDRQCLIRSPEAVVAYCDRSFLLVVGRRTIGRTRYKSNQFIGNLVGWIVIYIIHKQYRHKIKRLQLSKYTVPNHRVFT